jgi:hypothetical protein
VLSTIKIILVPNDHITQPQDGLVGGARLVFVRLHLGAIVEIERADGPGWCALTIQGWRLAVTVCAPCSHGAREDGPGTERAVDGRSPYPCFPATMSASLQRAAALSESKV